MPVLDMLPLAYFVNGDTGQKKTSKMMWDKKFITAEEIAVIIPIPEAVLDDSDYDIWGEVRPRVQEAFGKVIDGAVLFDVNKPDSWRDGIVTTATNAESVVTFGAQDNLYDKIMAERRRDRKSGGIRILCNRSYGGHFHACKIKRSERYNRTAVVQIGHAE